MNEITKYAKSDIVRVTIALLAEETTIERIYLIFAKTAFDLQ